MPVDMGTVKLPTMPPHEAARQLRQRIKDALKVIGSGPPKDVCFSKTSLALRLKEVTSFGHGISDRRGRTDIAIALLREAIKTRRTVEINNRLNLVVSRLNTERSAAQGAIDHIRFFDPEPYVPKAVVTQKTLEDWNTLVQCLPTVEELPTDRKDTVIRAIVAILRAANIEGIEGVTHVIKTIEEEQDGKKPDGEAVPVPGPIEAIEGGVEFNQTLVGGATVTVTTANTASHVVFGDDDKPF